MKKSVYKTETINLECLFKKTDENHPSVCVKVNSEDYGDFLSMCKTQGCRYEDDSEIDLIDHSRCAYLMEIGDDYRIAPRSGLTALRLQRCWHFNYSDIRNGLYLPMRNGCLNLTGLSCFDGDNSFMNETVRSLILPTHLAKDINKLFKGTDYRRTFNIYFCGNYEKAGELRSSFDIEELNGEQRQIKVIPYGVDCKDNIAHSYDRTNGFIEKRWVWGKRMLPEFLEERQITNSILVSDGDMYMYRNINPDTIIYTFIDSNIRGVSYNTQICLRDEKHMLPKIEKYLKDIGCSSCVFIKQGIVPDNEEAFLVGLDTDEVEQLGAVNYVDKNNNIKNGISIRTVNEKMLPDIPLEALTNYARLHREFNYIFFDQEEKEFRC